MLIIIIIASSVIMITLVLSKYVDIKISGLVSNNKITIAELNGTRSYFVLSCSFPSKTKKKTTRSQWELLLSYTLLNAHFEFGTGMEFHLCRHLNRDYANNVNCIQVRNCQNCVQFQWEKGIQRTKEEEVEVNAIRNRSLPVWRIKIKFDCMCQKPILNWIRFVQFSFDTSWFTNVADGLLTTTHSLSLHYNEREREKKAYRGWWRESSEPNPIRHDRPFRMCTTRTSENFVPISQLFRKKNNENKNYYVFNGLEFRDRIAIDFFLLFWHNMQLQYRFSLRHPNVPMVKRSNRHHIFIFLFGGDQREDRTHEFHSWWQCRQANTNAAYCVIQ